MTDLLFASSDEHPGLDEDSAPLLELLRERGLDCRVASWDDDRVDWADARAVIARSTWDYFDRREQFVAWAEAVEATGVPFWPGAQLIEWNSEKSYLRALEAAGIRCLPTVWCGRGNDPVAAIRQRGWDDVVVKPTIGGGASGLRRFSGVTIGQTETLALVEHVRELVRTSGGAMLQPYLPGVAEAGEVSVFFCEGRVTHAVRKLAADGEFRVQPEHGGSFALAEPTKAELDLATWSVAAVAARVGHPPLIARVDMVAGLDERPGVIEVELIEPRLFLRIAPGPADVFADAIAARLDGLV